MTRSPSGIVGAMRRICEIGTIAAFGVLIVVTMLQVIARLPWLNAPVFTEEVARFALIYLVAFSCGLATLRGELVNVDLFVGLLPPRARHYAGVLSSLLIIAFAAVIVPGAWKYLLNGFGERARSLDVPMVWVYAAVVIIPASLIFFSVARLLGYRVPKSEVAEEADGAAALDPHSQEDRRC